MKKHKIILISLGGAIICPKPGQVDSAFLKKFREMILRSVKKGYRFVIVTGGGKTSREYLKSAQKITKLSKEDMDWIGIYATKLNAQLVRTIFGKSAYPVIIDDPFQKISENDWKILVSSGWKPGWSTDYDTVLLAKRFGAKEIINASNTPYLYDKDFKKYKDALPIKSISWEGYQKIIGKDWFPGLSTPFDPIASEMAKKLKIRTFIIKGTDLKNFNNLITGKNFRGSTIE